MVRQILKKDWTLLWPLVAALTVVQGMLALARFRAGAPPNALPSVPVSLFVLLAASTLITLVVQQDPIPGTSQDWLVRPIPRLDLFVAKLVFVILFVQGPWLALDLIQGLASGFAPGESTTAAVACAVRVLLTVTVPVLAFATLAAGMTETLVGAVGVLAIVIAALVLPALAHITDPTNLTGFAWVPSLLNEMLLLGAALGVLVLQYGSRRTRIARGLFAVALVIGQCVSFLPWRTMSGLAEVLTPPASRARDDRGMALDFAPDAGRLRPAPGQALDEAVEKPGFGPADVAEENQRRRAEDARTVFIPVRLSGLVPESRLLADRSEVRVFARDGQLVYQGPTGNDVELHPATTAATIHHGIRVPGALYTAIKAERVDVQVDYWLTLFTPDATYALQARGGSQRMPGIGWCATSVDNAGTRVLFRCLQPGERPSCVAVVLEDTATHQRNPEVSLCVPDYSPYRGHVMPDAISRWVGRLPFYDPSGAVRYAVGGAQLATARVIVTSFKPAAHFIRRVRLPAIRLEDWEVQTSTSADASR